MNFLKIFSKFFLIVGLSGALVACGNESDSGTSAPATSSSAQISVGVWGGTAAEDTTRDQLFREFTEKTGIEIDLRVYSDYQTQLQTELIGGTAPDVFYVEAFLFPSLVEEGVLAPLDEYIVNTDNFDKEDFYSPALNAFTTQSGEIFGLPKDLSTLGLYYNETLLAEAGFTPEDIPTEITELAEFLVGLNEKLSEGIVPAITSAELPRHMFVMQAGGTTIIDEEGFARLTHPEQLDYLQMLVDAYAEGLVQRPEDLGHDWSGDSFGAENAVLMIEGNWAIAHLEQNFPDVQFGTKEIPTFNGNRESMMFTVSYSINANSNHKAEAWEFINFVTGKEGMTTWAGGASLIPSRSSSADALNLQDNQIMAPFVEAANYATPWQNGPTLAIALREYDNMISAALTGEMTLQEAMEQAERVANSDIEAQLK